MPNKIRSEIEELLTQTADPASTAVAEKDRRRANPSLQILKGHPEEVA